MKKTNHGWKKKKISLRKKSSKGGIAVSGLEKKGTKRWVGSSRFGKKAKSHKKTKKGKTPKADATNGLKGENGIVTQPARSKKNAKNRICKKLQKAGRQGGKRKKTTPARQ